MNNQQIIDDIKKEYKVDLNQPINIDKKSYINMQNYGNYNLFISYVNQLSYYVVHSIDVFCISEFDKYTILYFDSSYVTELGERIQQTGLGDFIVGFKKCIDGIYTWILYLKDRFDNVIESIIFSENIDNFKYLFNYLDALVEYCRKSGAIYLSNSN